MRGRPRPRTGRPHPSSRPRARAIWRPRLRPSRSCRRPSRCSAATPSPSAASCAMRRATRWTGRSGGVTTIGPFELRSIKDEVPDTYVLRGTEYGEAVIGVFLGLPGQLGGEPNWTPAAELPVKVNDYPVARIDIDPPAWASYAGTSFGLTGRAITTAGEEHAEEVVRWSSADEAVATVTADGRLELVAPGTVAIAGEAGGVRGELTLEVVANPVEALAVASPDSRVRTGDVVRLAVTAADGAGAAVEDIALAYRVDMADGAATTAATAYGDGAFVAEEPGQYRVSVDAGTTAEAVDIEVFPREGRREVTLVGQGPLGTSTSDLWVFEGLDGRDYAYTGTMSAATMYAWDVTDPRRAPHRRLRQGGRPPRQRRQDQRRPHHRHRHQRERLQPPQRHHPHRHRQPRRPGDDHPLHRGTHGRHPQRLVRGRPGLRHQRRHPRRPYHRHLRSLPTPSRPGAGVWTSRTSTCTT